MEKDGAMLGKCFWMGGVLLVTSTPILFHSMSMTLHKVQRGTVKATVRIFP